MSRKKFFIILIAVLLVGTILTAAHMVYICKAYENSSIIQFVAREMWL